MDVDVHQLRTFVAIAECGSFSGAARELGYTQSAVSQHIAALEASLGATLLERRPVALTVVGARLLEHARPLLLRFDAAKVDIARLNSAPPVTVSIGLSPLAMTRRTAEALQQATVHVLTREDVVAKVAAGKVDLGLIDGLTAPSDPLNLPDVGPFTAARVSEQPVTVALPKSHPLATRKGLRLSDLADAHWIDAPGTAIPLTQLRAATGTDAFHPALRYEGTDIHTLTTLIAAGKGLAILPPIGPELAFVPVTAPRVVHRVEVLYSSTVDGPAAALARALAG
ncbi:LysR family transcriptional regulator [Actinocrispum sp. NPDC049592]|uniref:LysR family transcriptional regulator n=1 Tax=Actinocrispum sp. NPDC049592 TaxID=3154835 RepID=UPI00344A9FAF